MNAALESWRTWPRRHPVWTSVAGVLLLLILLLALFDWNWAKRPVQRIVSAATGREFRIDGDLEVDYLPLEVHAQRVYFGNAHWSEQPAMAQIERIDTRVRFWPLLVGRVVLPELSVDRPRLRLERNAAGIGNWVLGSAPGNCQPGQCPTRLRILQLLVHEGLLEFREPTLQTALDLHLDSARPSGDAALAPLVLRGTGSYRGGQFELRGRVDSPLTLQDRKQHYSLDLTARAGDTYANLYGTLTEPLQFENIAVNLDLGGADLARLYDLAGIVLPTSPPYELTGRLTRNGSRIGYRDFTGNVGDSDLSGSAEIDIGGPRPKLTAQLQSKLIDLDDLAGFLGGTPGTGAGEIASPEQRAEKRAMRARGKVLPDKPIRVERLRAMDADVRLTAARVQSPRLPLENMTAHLRLDDGQLTLDPLDFGAAGGELVTTARFDGRQSPARFGFTMRIRQLQLPKLMPRVKALRDSTGNLAGTITLEGRGDSTASALANANGDVSLIMGSGRVSNLLLEIAGLDIAEALEFLLTRDQQVKMRCAYADFGIVDGVATARAVAIDTTDTALLIRGDFDLGKESLDLRLLPRPKDISLVSVRTPIRIGGTFADPDIHPEGKPLVLRGAAVAALAAIAPPLALLGLVEPGPGHDTGCGGDQPRKKKEAPVVPPGPRPPPPAPA